MGRALAERAAMSGSQLRVSLRKCPSPAESLTKARLAVRGTSPWQPAVSGAGLAFQGSQPQADAPLPPACRQVVREHWEGQSPQRLEDTVWSQHIPGTSHRPAAPGTGNGDGPFQALPDAGAGWVPQSQGLGHISGTHTAAGGV